MLLVVFDNWLFDQVYNVKVNDMMDVIDNVLKKGYIVVWVIDVSEKSFSWKNGVVYVLIKKYDDMIVEEKVDMFNGLKVEFEIILEMCQVVFDNYQIIDDYGMYIIGLVKD